MNALTVGGILLAALLAGCAASGTGAAPTLNQRAECEQQRGGGVWLPSAGACLRGGGM